MKKKFGNSLDLMSSLLLRNLFFIVLQPGVVTGLVPYLLAKDAWQGVSWTPVTLRIAGATALFCSGLIILLTCVFKFAKEGKGTLSPLDPTRRLVVSGVYRLSRNPMYVGVMFMLLAEAWLTGSTTLWIYASVIFTCFHLFILLHEEPRLKNDFPDEYPEYFRKVRRWI
ncbi:MAG TPA: isoprenylcysteine carboxylmethyltransferase family protein [Chryseosolibacter sp.]|nr:isoprenylcysteine carboxylmethyltransferase family protein [Chryseosolibacter sp.]